MLFLAFAAMASARVRSATRLPLPPVPPHGGASDQLAPSIGAEVEQPTQGIGTQGPSIAPAWYGERNYSASQGFTPGSQMLTRPSGRMELAPGLEFRVPLK